MKAKTFKNQTKSLSFQDQYQDHGFENSSSRHRKTKT